MDDDVSVFGRVLFREGVCGWSTIVLFVLEA